MEEYILFSGTRIARKWHHLSKYKSGMKQTMDWIGRKVAKDNVIRKI